MSNTVLLGWSNYQQCTINNDFTFAIHSAPSVTNIKTVKKKKTPMLKLLYYPSVIILILYNLANIVLMIYVNANIF